VPYLLADVELSRPLPRVSLAAGEDGVALLVRRYERPLGYLLRALAPGTVLGPGGLGELIADELRVALVREAIADQLLPAGELAEPELTVVAGSVSDRELQAASTPYVAFVSADAVPDAGWRAGVAEALAEQPDAAAVTGLVLPRALDTAAQVAFERAGGFHLGFETLRFAGERRPEEPFYPVDTRALGAVGNLVVRRDAALAAGGAGAGEGDLLYRLVRAGHALAYEPRMLVFHSRAPGPEETGARLVAQAARTARTDPGDRGRARRALGWWAARAAKRLLTGPIASDPRSRPVVVAELREAAAAARRSA
jgi:hypothetical protein